MITSHHHILADPIGFTIDKNNKLNVLVSQIIDMYVVCNILYIIFHSIICSSYHEIHIFNIVKVQRKNMFRMWSFVDGKSHL